MAKSYLKAETNTEMWRDVQQTVRNMRKLQEDLIRLNDIFGQVGLDGNDRVAEILGFKNAEDALAVKTLLGSVKKEILANPFFQRTISQVG